MNYLKDTKNAYKNEIKAKEYQEQYTKGYKWARFAMWRQKLIIKKILKKCNITKNNNIIDIPCGAGYIGRILCNTGAEITASDISKEMINVLNT